MLLYNPLSGRRKVRRLADVEAALAVLREAGVEASLEPTLGQAEAGGQARQAIAVVQVDGIVPEAVVSELRGIPAVQQAMAIRLD